MQSQLSAQDLADFFGLLPRIYADYRDPRRGPLELLYLYSNTKDNEDSIFLRAIELAQAGHVRRLGIAEGDLGFGYEGYDHSVARLRALGWNDQVPIEKFDLKGNVNTRSEAIALARRASALNGDVGIVAVPFHLPRAFMTTVTNLTDAVRVYAYSGVAVPWLQKVVHSQGVVQNTRAGLLQDELLRLEKYRAPQFGNMLDAQKVIEYLNWRDA